MIKDIVLVVSIALLFFVLGMNYQEYATKLTTQGVWYDYTI